jgi:enoyl-CoA hydratase
MQHEPFSNILYEVRDRTAWVTVNRPERLNALDRRTFGEIAAAIDLAEADAAVSAIVLTGAGEKAFAAGADIGEMSSMSPAQALEFARFLHASLSRIERASKPVVAALNGFALGGGCELAMACHVRIASENARFGQPEVNLGLIPGAGGTQRLQRIVGRGRALDLILTGDMIDAAEALRIGLVTRVVPQAALAQEAAALAAKLGAKGPRALELALDAVLSGGEVAESEALRLESSLFALCFATEDMREGTRAFLEKRKPSFQGR